jgi:hypothetical protein
MGTSRDPVLLQVDGKFMSPREKQIKIDKIKEHRENARNNRLTIDTGRRGNNCSRQQRCSPHHDAKSPDTVYRTEAGRQSETAQRAKLDSRNRAFSPMSQSIGRNSEFRDSMNKSRATDKAMMKDFDPN